MLLPYFAFTLDISELIVIWISLVIWVPFELWEFIGALGWNILNFIQSYIFYSHLDVYVYLCPLCVFVYPLDTGRELDAQKVFQKSSSNVLCMFRMRAVPKAGTYI